MEIDRVSETQVQPCRKKAFLLIANIKQVSTTFFFFGQACSWKLASESSLTLRVILSAFNVIYFPIRKVPA